MHDHRTPETQLFSSAVEAKFLRIKPVSWQKWISMLVRVLGCSSTSSKRPDSKGDLYILIVVGSSYSKLPFTVLSIRMRKNFLNFTSKSVSGCNEPMGLENGKMNPNQVTVSSKMKNFTPKDASLSSSSGWAPFLASSNQWIQVRLPSEKTSK